MCQVVCIFFSFSLADAILNVSMLIVFCDCNLNSVQRNLFVYVFVGFFLTFCSVFVWYSLFKCEKLRKANKLQKNKLKMCQVNKTHSGQFTLSTFQAFRLWGERK